jgi:hypothetical protein
MAVKTGLLLNSTRLSFQVPVAQEENGNRLSRGSPREHANRPMTCCSCGSSGTKIRLSLALRGKSAQRAVNRLDDASLRELQRLLRNLDHEKQMAVQQARLQPWRR